MLKWWMGPLALMAIWPVAAQGQCETLRMVVEGRGEGEDGCWPNSRPSYVDESRYVDHQYGFTIHYTDSKYDNRRIDADAIAGLAGVLRETMDHFHGERSFKRPLSDGRDIWRYCDEDTGADGGDGGLDIYIVNDPYSHGYTRATSGGSSQTAAAYLAISNWTFEDWDLLQVTVAHEYFHAIQFAHDRFESLSFMESSAMWAEESQFDGINDYHRYLEPAFLWPDLPIEHESTIYAMAIWARFLTEQLGWNKMRTAWQRCADTYGNNALEAVAGLYEQSREGGFAQALLDFRVAQVDRSQFEEGAYYPEVTIHRHLALEDLDFQFPLKYTGAYLSQWQGNINRRALRIGLPKGFMAQLLWQEEGGGADSGLDYHGLEGLIVDGNLYYQNLPPEGFYTLVVVNGNERGIGEFEVDFMIPEEQPMALLDATPSPEALDYEGQIFTGGCHAPRGELTSAWIWGMGLLFFRRRPRLKS